MINARINPTPLYNPTRDLAHCFGAVMKEAVTRLSERRWSALDKYLRDAQVSEADIAAAITSACEFVRTASDKPHVSMEDWLKEKAWFNLPTGAQIALTAAVGTVIMGYFWSGAREATLGGCGPCQTMQHLSEDAAKAVNILVNASPAKG